VSKLNRMPQEMPRAGGYSRLLALILASLVDASASTFMPAAATSWYLAGVVIVGSAGQVTRTTGCMASGWIRWMVMLSPDGVIWPWAN
jgi:hypothetical protein